MRYLRILGLLAVAAIAPMASAGTASGTTFTSPAGTSYTGTIVAKSVGHAVSHLFITNECSWTLELSISSHGTGVTAGGNILSAGFSGCTNNWHMTTVSAGTFAVSWTSGSNGKVTSSGMTIEATRFGITCRYATSGTTLGTLTGGASPTIDIGAAFPFHSGSGLCGAGSVPFTGVFEVTSPNPLFVDH